jgi:hypothetical protein
MQPVGVIVENLCVRQYVHKVNTGRYALSVLHARVRVCAPEYGIQLGEWGCSGRVQ